MLVVFSIVIILGVYGIVVVIVKMDDVGLYLLRKLLIGFMNII